MKKRAGLAGALLLIFACASEDVTFPIKPAPASPHDALKTALDTDAQGFDVVNGDWLDDQGDASFYGLAVLARTGGDVSAALARARGMLASGTDTDTVLAALGILEYVAASGDRTDVPLLDSFLDRLPTDYVQNAPDLYGPTAATALIALAHAEFALAIGTGDHLARAKAMEQAITDVALDDLVNAVTGQEARGYQRDSTSMVADLLPNAIMMRLESRLYRLTQDDTYMLEARATYAAAQLVKLPDPPSRYASPGEQARLGIMNPDVATLATQNYLALGLLGLFEITGDESFITECDSLFDAITTMRGPWCESQVVGSSVPDKCTTGLLYDVVDDMLPTTAPVFCSGCSLQTRYVLGLRRLLANEAF